VTNPYRVLGAEVPELLGRGDLVSRIEVRLDRSSPDHVSVVGPAMYGKTVLLRELARCCARPGPTSRST
jgi:ABC-type phosphate/phosphonate transport system ATPase subunit